MKKLPGVVIINSKVFKDLRGFFLETYSPKILKKIGISDKFIQDNHSRSKKNVLRGLHYQINNPQSQIVTLLRGKIYYVVVDLRKKSPTFSQWNAFYLSETNSRQLYIPPGVASGFCTLSNYADIHYKVSQLYNNKDEGGILWNDSYLNIKWPIKKPIINKRDKSFPNFKDIVSHKLPKNIKK